MTFPETNWFGGTEGWEKRGEIKPLTTADGKTSIDVCSYCKNPVFIGRENGIIFKYCEVCLKKVNEH